MNSLYDEFRVAVHSVWTRRWLVLAVAWGICILGWLAIASIPNRYDSRARLLVDVNQILPDEAGGGRGPRIDQIRETLTSARNMEKVAATTGLLPAGANDRDKAGTVAMLQKNIKVVPQQDNIFEITSSIAVGSLSDADNAKLASGVLDSLITVFRDDQLRGGRMNAREGLKFLDAQIADREGAGGGGGMQNPAYASLAAMRAERQATVSALSARKSQLMGDIAKITAQQIQNPGIAAEYDRINGEYTAFKAQYDKLLGQREQVRLRGEVQTETDAIKIELLDPPSKPTSPAAPNRPLFLTLVLLAGIGGGIAAAFGLGQVRTSYATAAKLERASGLPVIGSITEVVTPERHVERRKKLVWLASGGGALVGLYALLLVAEFIQRGMVA